MPISTRSRVKKISKPGSDGKMPPKRIDIMDKPQAMQLRRKNKEKAMGIPSDFQIMTREPRDPTKDPADVPRRPNSITINQYAYGGYVCKPNPRKGNIDMRKKGMTRMTKDNRKKG